jgi:hypothetical protein
MQLVKLFEKKEGDNIITKFHVNHYIHTLQIK